MTAGPLRQVIEKSAAEHGLPMKDLTVLAAQSDPFRVDTPTGHRDGAWLAAIVAGLQLGGRKIHLRGVHYALTDLAPGETPYTKPEGAVYANDIVSRWTFADLCRRLIDSKAYRGGAA
jgi:hypothetical protein